jgi:hypothetical protein
MEWGRRVWQRSVYGMEWGRQGKRSTADIINFRRGEIAHHAFTGIHWKCPYPCLPTKFETSDLVRIDIVCKP